MQERCVGIIVKRDGSLSKEMSQCGKGFVTVKGAWRMKNKRKKRREEKREKKTQGLPKYCKKKNNFWKNITGSRFCYILGRCTINWSLSDTHDLKARQSRLLTAIPSPWLLHDNRYLFHESWLCSAPGMLASFTLNSSVGRWFNQTGHSPDILLLDLLFFHLAMLAGSVKQSSVDL